MKMEKATFAAGCFWGIEAAFAKTRGVVDHRVGYTGGHTEKPTYGQVCSDATGHAEAVEVTFDPNKVSFSKLLSLFWKIHDPTQFNRQGPDIGSQYRSAIFYHNAKQKIEAQESMKSITKGRKIATQIAPAGKFWPAEEYHQRYYEKHKTFACAANILKKVK